MADSVPVSVVIPAYNASRTLPQTLESIAAQAVSPDEVIVVDDGSTDDTAALAERSGARVLRQENGGVSRARNAGVEIARNDWIALLDADDTWGAGKLERQWQALQSAPEARFSFTDYVQGDDPASVFGQHAAYRSGNQTTVAPNVALWQRDELLKIFCKEDFILPSTAMIRRDVYRMAGGFDPALKYHEDFEFFCRVLKLTDAVAVEAVLCDYGRHETQVTSDHETWALERLRTYERMIGSPERYPAVAIDVLRAERPAWAANVGLTYLRRRQLAESRAVLARAQADRPTRRVGALLAAVRVARFPGGLLLVSAVLNARRSLQSRRRGSAES